ncbi:hypothetical protein M1D72_14050 [Vibrio sp. AK197]
MALLGYCDISNFKLTPKSKHAVAEIQDIMDAGNLMAGVLAATPFYYIFGSPGITNSPFEKMITIREHDWEQLGQSMASVPKIVKGRIYKVAEPMTWSTNGQERKFWECVSNASL